MRAQRAPLRLPRGWNLAPLSPTGRYAVVDYWSRSLAWLGSYWSYCSHAYRILLLRSLSTWSQVRDHFAFGLFDCRSQPSHLRLNTYDLVRNARGDAPPRGTLQPALPRPGGARCIPQAKNSAVYQTRQTDYSRCDLRPRSTTVKDKVHTSSPRTRQAQRIRRRIRAHSVSSRMLVQAHTLTALIIQRTSIEKACALHCR
jgi:hypothetical protein